MRWTEFRKVAGAMPRLEATPETGRWQIVNYIRTLEK